MNKQVFAAAVATVFAMGAAQGVAAQETAIVSVNYEIAAINEFSFGTPAKLMISSYAEMTAGVTQSSTWNVTTNQTGTAVTASVAGLDTDVTLNVFLAAPANATSAAQDLSGTAVQLVSGITDLSESGLAATYILSALPTAGVIADKSVDVTFTLVAGV